MRADPYDLFARVYDAWQNGYDQPFSTAIFAFYEREILRRGVPDPSLADLACGTGTFLKLWAERHPDWRLVGTDRSDGMLRVARRKLLLHRVRPDLLHQPLESLSLPRRIGVAVSVFDSVNHLTRIRDLRRFFRGVTRSLLPGGLFLFDLNDERVFARLFSGTWTVEDDRLFVSITASSDAGGIRGRLHFTIFEKRARAWCRHGFSIEERNWRRFEVEKALRDASILPLNVRRIQPYPSGAVDAPRTLWICRKPITSPERPR